MSKYGEFDNELRLTLTNALYELSQRGAIKIIDDAYTLEYLLEQLLREEISCPKCDARFELEKAWT